MTIHEAAKLIKENKISSTELTKEALKKISECDERVFISLCDDALQQAESADREKRETPLKGIPVAIKDNICTKNVLTTAGSKILSDFVPPYDATVVKKLKENGAVIIGKTNMDEFGMGNSGENSAFGELSNPLNKDYVPGGSSGGSAVAVKREMAFAALGTDTGGSVRQPASFCGLYALKPTYSLVSRYGLIAFASSLDVIGPICKTTADLAIMMHAIAGFDRMDSTSSLVKRGNYYENLNCDIRDIKIGIPKEYFENIDIDIKEKVLSCIKNFESMGAKTEECSIPSLKYATSAYYIISSSEASSNLARYDGVKFGKRTEQYESLEEMYVKTRSENFGAEVKRRILLGTFSLSAGYYDLYYLRAKRAQNIIKSDFKNLFEKYDLLLTPVSPVAVWKKGEGRGINGEYPKDFCTASVNLAGLPAISVPCGSDRNNMPVSFQLIGREFSEQMLLNAAYAYEKGGF